ncbi:MAG: hypothetical protein PHS77_09860 [Gallionellaceae bacterium]|nr:hypothetical protein [Gallionellaceae bacterium]
MTTITRLFQTLLAALLLSSAALAKDYEDRPFGFHITVPDNWSQQATMNGKDRMFTATSPDGNLAVQIHAVDLSQEGITADLLRQAFEQSAIKGAKLAGSQAHSLNGIQGLLAAYRTWSNGASVVIAAFYTIQGKRGYVITTMVPEALYQSRVAEGDAVTNSFRLLPTEVPAPVRPILAQTPTAPIKSAPPVQAPVQRPAPAAAPATGSDERCVYYEYWKNINDRHTAGIDRPNLYLSFRHPAGWQVEDENDYSIKLVKRDGRGGLPPTFFIQNAVDPSYKKLMDVVDDILAQHRAGKENLQIWEEAACGLDAFALNGQPFQGYRFMIRYRKSGKDYMQMALVFKRPELNGYHIVNMHAPADSWDKDMADMLGMLRSLRVKALDG